MLGKAISLAARLFEDIKDKGGQDYILHCLEVWRGVRHLDEDTQCAAILHDVVEDTPISLENLRDMKYSYKTVTIVDALSKRPNERYMDMIERIMDCEFKEAINIKMSDLRHNSDITRLKGISKDDAKRNVKYHRAYTLLKSSL